MPLFTLWPYRSHARQSRADRSPLQEHFFAYMRIPVFARRSNPAIDPPIIRKSVSYAEAQVSDRLADWVDVNDKRRGIIAREYLPRTGDVILAQEPESLSPICGAEIPGIKFQEPLSALWRRDPASKSACVRLLPPEVVTLNRYASL